MGMGERQALMSQSDSWPTVWTVRVRDHHGNKAIIPAGGTARQIGLEAAWWWGYTITRQSHFSVAKDGEVVPYDERPKPGEYELVEVGGIV